MKRINVVTSRNGVDMYTDAQYPTGVEMLQLRLQAIVLLHNIAQWHDVFSLGS